MFELFHEQVSPRVVQGAWEDRLNPSWFQDFGKNADLIQKYVRDKHLNNPCTSSNRMAHMYLVFLNLSDTFSKLCFNRFCWS